jgi:hypothetical protein
MDAEAAKEHLRGRILPRIDDDFGRVIFLASTLDHNTGRYYHKDLALLFAEPVAALALAACHREVFRRQLSLACNLL